jgi:8-oxo-dGTP diphosphatase
MMADESSFRNKLRIRVCGLLVEEDAILLAQVHSPVTNSLVWMPPGGGVQFGEHMQDCLKREFAEETNLQIKAQDLLHINELVEPPFHALEFYFEVTKREGKVEMGSDPELSWNQQLLHDLKWMPFGELENIPFAPQSLLPKVLDWGHRYGISVFKNK